MKILCVCEGGNVRSVTMAYLLKSNGMDAIACGVLWNKPETVSMLSDWAEMILLAEGRLNEKIPETNHGKIIDMEIGPDIWGQSMVPGLVNLCLARFQDKLKDKLH